MLLLYVNNFTNICYIFLFCWPGGSGAGGDDTPPDGVVIIVVLCNVIVIVEDDVFAWNEGGMAIVRRFYNSGIPARRTYRPADNRLSFIKEGILLPYQNR